MTNYTIYGLHHIEDDPSYVHSIRYVGQTYQDLNTRIRSHFSSARNGDQRNVCLWISEVGERNVAVVVLETGPYISDEEVDLREKHYIAQYLAADVNLLNMTSGGTGTRGYTWPEELRNRRSAEGNSFYGKNHTDETRVLLSEAAKERWKREDYLTVQRENFATRVGIQNSWKGGETHPFYGKNHKQSTRQLISQRGLEKWQNATEEDYERARQAGIKASHTRWHVSKGKVSPKCSLCCPIME